MKNILFSIIFMISFLIIHLFSIVILSPLIKQFELTHMLSKFIASGTMLFIMYKIRLINLTRFGRIDMVRLLIYVLVAVAIGFTYQLLRENELYLEFERNIFLMISALVVAPVMEEIIFRGLALEYLSKYGVKKYVRVVATTLVFGLVHLPYNSLFDLYLFLLGFILALVYEKERNLYYCIAIHFIVSVIIFFT